MRKSTYIFLGATILLLLANVALGAAVWKSPSQPFSITAPAPELPLDTSLNTQTKTGLLRLIQPLGSNRALELGYSNAISGVNSLGASQNIFFPLITVGGILNQTRILNTEGALFLNTQGVVLPNVATSSLTSAIEGTITYSDKNVYLKDPSGWKVIGSGGSSGGQWSVTSSGALYTLSPVGVGTDNPQGIFDIQGNGDIYLKSGTKSGSVKVGNGGMVNLDVSGNVTISGSSGSQTQYENRGSLSINLGSHPWNGDEKFNPPTDWWVIKGDTKYVDNRMPCDSSTFSSGDCSSSVYVIPGTSDKYNFYVGASYTDKSKPCDANTNPCFLIPRIDKFAATNTPGGSLFARKAFLSNIVGNAELDLQSGGSGNWWGIYNDIGTQDLRFWYGAANNGTNSVIFKSNGSVVISSLANNDQTKFLTTDPHGKLLLTSAVMRKACVFETGNVMSTTPVPDSWTASSCSSYAGAIGATSYRLACIFDNDFSIGASVGDLIPPKNCGWPPATARWEIASGAGNYGE